MSQGEVEPGGGVFRRHPVIAWTVTVAVAFLAMATLVIGAVVIVINSRPQTTVTLTASGGTPGAQDLSRAKDVLAHRLDAIGFDNPEVRVTSAGLVATVDGRHKQEEFVKILAPGEVRFRKVIDVVADPASDRPPPAAASGSEATPSQQDVSDKLGATAVATAQRIVSTNAAPTDPATMAALEPFARLTPAEVATLSPQTQFKVPQVTCAALNARPARSIVDVTQPVVACQADGDQKMLLDNAKVVGTDVGAAVANLSQSGNGWTISLTFNAAGATKWTSLSREAFNNEGTACIATQPGNSSGGAVCQVAIVLDTVILTAPAIQGVLGAEAEISGGFDRDSAELIAALLGSGSMPLALTIASVSSE
jgi:preprotein translocase subunit SecD